MRILTYTTLYPNAVQPHHGVFVEQRLRRVRAQGDVTFRVIAPVPWFPARHPRFGRFAGYASVPHFQARHGVPVSYPRYPLIPRVIPAVGRVAAPLLMAAATQAAVRKAMRDGFNFDILDAHYFYPDGVAAALIAQRLGKPLVITARGSDINLVPRYRLPRRMILWAAARAAAIITVCQALKDELVKLGADAKKITVLRNGVDLELFRPEDPSEQRARLGLTRPTLLSVGHLIERKGHHLAIQALPELGDVDLLIVGQGREKARLQELVRSLDVQSRVRFLGVVSQEELRRYYSAADVLVLASSREGWANVLLEAMACGTPVVATRVWGTPEVVSAPEAGVLVDERTPAALIKAVRQLLGRYPKRTAVRRYAERFSWDETASAQFDLYRRIVRVT
ncbi:MAG: glycosyltransferase family 4 protein [Candidatus Entotheonellia bacterium]